MKTIDTDFNLDRHLIGFLQDSPFFAELSRHIHKTPTGDIPTAAVAFNEKTDEIVLYWNPTFFGNLTAREIRGVLTHEFYHLVFGHLYGRRRTPPTMWNIATDLAINSIIFDNAKKHGSNLEGDRPLPEFCLVPGVFPKHPEGRDYTTDEKAAMKIASIIEKFPVMQASEWYFDKLMEEAKNDPELGAQMMAGDVVIGSMDDHGGWDGIPDELREYVEGKVKSVVEKAVKHADSQANGWGNMPSDLADAIRKSVSNVVNWRNVLRQFVGSIVRGGRTSSMKKINKKYPYIHPGTKRGYQAKLLVAVDQSGSVHNEMLAQFFGELGSLTKKVTVDVLPFDCEAHERDIFTWHKGSNPQLKRVRGGGTDFNAPTNLANSPKNRGRWDGVLVLTDGEAPPPGASRLKRGWVLGKGCKLMFKSPELQVFMDDSKPMAGAWR